MIYSDKYNGYIADNPNLIFIRCDGRPFYFDEVNTASMNNTANVLTITGGQGNYPQAYIETDKSLEFTFTSSQFTMEMFEMANAVSMEEGDVGVWETARYNVEEGLTINIPYEVKPNTVKIRGLEEADATAAGKFKVAITASTAEVAGKTVITLHEGDATVGDTVRVTYTRRAVGAQTIAIKTNSGASKGELTAEYPVYSAGTDCTESSVKGKLRIYMPRVRVTASPNFDNSLTEIRLPVQ